MASQWELLEDVIPDDGPRQTHSTAALNAALEEIGPRAAVLDLGCGRGASRKLVVSGRPEARWIGVDIATSPEVDARSKSTAVNIVTYDGVNLPFMNCGFSIVYSHQVLEHVRHPEALLAEVRRVLRPGGLFVGSTSNLEPYHSFSLWNFTPYGFRVIVESAGLALESLEPGIDGPTIIERQIRGRPPEMSSYFVQTSPVNQEIMRWGEQTRRRAALVNNRMLQFCGQFVFRCRRP